MGKFFRCSIIFCGLFLIPTLALSQKRENYLMEQVTDGLLQIQLTGVLETCNKCMGYGSVQDGLYGTPQICKFCWVSTWMLIQQGWTGFNGRYGVVDAAFNKLPPNYFDKLEMNGHNEMPNNGEFDRNQV